MNNDDMQKERDDFIARAGFAYGWSNLESWSRKMARQAVEELQRLQAHDTEATRRAEENFAALGKAQARIAELEAQNRALVFAANLKKEEDEFVASFSAPAAPSPAAVKEEKPKQVEAPQPNFYNLVTLGLSSLKQDYSPECLQMASVESYVEDAVASLVREGWRPTECKEHGLAPDYIAAKAAAMGEELPPSNAEIRKLMHHYSHMHQPGHYSDTEFDCMQDMIAFARACMTLRQPAVLTDAQISRLGKDLARKVYKEVIRVVRAFGEKACADYIETYHGADTVIAILAASQEVGK